MTPILWRFVRIAIIFTSCLISLSFTLIFWSWQAWMLLTLIATMLLDLMLEGAKKAGSNE
jgi:hypothetical protein